MRFWLGRAGRATEGIDDCVLLGTVEDAVDEDGEVSAEQREVDAEFAEGCGFSRLGHGRWDLVAGDGGGFEGFALVGVFAGDSDGVDEGVAVGDDQAADVLADQRRPCSRDEMAAYSVAYQS